MPASNNSLSAIALMCSATFLFTILDTTAKYLGGTLGLPVLEVVWLRFAGHTLFAFILFGPKTFTSLVRTRKPLLQISRSIFVASATAFNFLAVTYLQLDLTMTMFFMTPLIVAILSGPVLGEWVGWHRLMAIAVGFIGVLLVTRPGFGGVHWAIYFSICATISYALYFILTRYLTIHDPVEVTNFYTPIAGAIIAMPFGIHVWQWPENPFTWFLIALLGICGGLGHWLVVLASQLAPASITAPYMYTGLLSISLMGYLVFGDIPTLWTLAGGLVIILSGLYILFRQKN